MNIINKLKIAGFCGLVALGYAATETVLVHQFTSDEIRVKNFYRLEKNSIDMVFIGASTSFTDYSAPLAYHEKGITSYSLATNMAPMGLAKSMLKEARKTQDAKVYVIDVNGVLYTDKNETKEGSLRLWIDNMKLSINKCETVKELVPSKKRFSYLFPIMKYHGNWEKLEDSFAMTKAQLENMFDRDHLSISGMEGNSKIDPQTNVVDIKTYPNATKLYPKSGKALQDLLEYCKSEDIKNVVFTNMPRFYNPDNINQRGVILAAKNLVQEYGYKFYDFDDYVTEIGLDPLTDFYNTNHLNIYGQKKFTPFMVDMIQKDFDLTSQHSDEVIAHWDQEYQTYETVYQKVDEMIKNNQNKRYNYEHIRNWIEEEN